MKTYKSLTLKDAAEITMGQSPAGEDCNRNGIGLPLLNGPTEFGPTHPYPTQFTADARKQARPGDLLFCVRGSTTGRMNWADQKYAIGRGIAGIRHKTNPKLQPLIRAAIEHQLPVLLQAATGSTFPNVSGLQLAAIPFPDLEAKQAEAIAATLGALDDKIELNRKMNATLEAMARALFRDWFVDFGPTRARMAGTAPTLSDDLWPLFPDRLDADGKPEGWETFKLGHIAEHHTKTLTPARMADAEVEHFSLPAFDKGQIPAIDLGSTIKSNKTLVPPQAVLLSKLNPEIPRVWMPETHSQLQQVSSTEFLAFTAKGGAGRSLLFCLFSDERFREMLHGMVTGTSKSHQRISPPSLLGSGPIKLLAHVGSH